MAAFHDLVKALAAELITHNEFLDLNEDERAPIRAQTEKLLQNTKNHAEIAASRPIAKARKFTDDIPSRKKEKERPSLALGPTVEYAMSDIQGGEFGGTIVAGTDHTSLGGNTTVEISADGFTAQGLVDSWTTTIGASEKPAEIKTQGRKRRSGPAKGS